MPVDWLKPTDYIIYKSMQTLYSVACSRSFSASILIFYSRIHPHTDGSFDLFLVASVSVPEAGL